MNLEELKEIAMTSTITKEQVQLAQSLETDAKSLADVYYIMAKYYQQQKNENAVVFCCMRAKKLLRDNQLYYDFKMNEMIEVKTDFLIEKENIIRKKILIISITLGVFTMLSLWIFMQIDWVVSFIFMNIVSVAFFTIGNKKTLATFYKKQLAACRDFLDEEDKEFAYTH